MSTQILMPALSPTMTEGKLSRWVKQVGEEVHAGDVIAEIETDKATMEVEAVDEGTLTQILVDEGTEGVAVNTPIAVLAARHVEGLGRRVDDLVNRLHREVHGHELDDRLQSVQRGADRHAGEAVLGDRHVDHPLGAELVEQALADLVGALILRDFLAHQEHVGVAAHLQRHGVAQGLAHRLLEQRPRPFRLDRGGGRSGGRRGSSNRRCGRRLWRVLGRRHLRLRSLRRRGRLDLGLRWC